METCAASRAIVGVEVVNTGSDQRQLHTPVDIVCRPRADVVNTGSDQRPSEPRRQQVERRPGRKVREHLFDGGCVKKEMIERAELSGVAIYASLPSGKDGRPCVEGRGDPPGVTAWRQRMTTPQGQEIYRERAA